MVSLHKPSAAPINSSDTTDFLTDLIVMFNKEEKWTSNLGLVAQATVV